MEQDILFKKASFGGFNKEDVMNYIAKITDEFQSYKKESEKKYSELSEFKIELEYENSKLSKTNEELKIEISELKKEIESLKELKLSEKEKNSKDDDKDEIKEIINNLYKKIGEYIDLSGKSEKMNETPVLSNNVTAEVTSDDELLKLIDKYVD